MIRTYPFTFSSALYRLPDGLFDKGHHLNMVLPIRKHLMDHDGLVDCTIGRYGGDVQTISGMVTEQKLHDYLLDALQAVISTSEESRKIYFPYLGLGINMLLTERPEEE